MIPDNHEVQLFRFDKFQWIEQFIKGEISFSCIGRWIQEAVTTGNDVQGDRFEGVFARLKSNDTRVNLYRKEIGSDLEILVDPKDKEYVLLRRESAKLIPVFCLYGISASDMKQQISTQYDSVPKGKFDFRYDFDERLFEGFAKDKSLLAIASVQPKPFINNIHEAISDFSYRTDQINYDEFSNTTFCIEPTSDYNELFYKFPCYDYQHERRFVLRNAFFSNFDERKNIPYKALDENDYRVVRSAVYLIFGGVQLENRE